MKTSLQARLLVLTLLPLGACTSLFYQPSQGMIFPLEMIRAPQPETLKLPTSDGGHLYSWHFKAQKGSSKGLVLLFHGNAGNISSHYLALLWILEEGWDFMVFDYRGYGGSPFGPQGGGPSPESTVADGVIALDWAVARQKKAGGKLVVLGQSLGGAIAPVSLAKSQLKDSVDLLVLEGTFHSYQEAARKTLASTWIGWPLQWLAYLLVSDRQSSTKILPQLVPLPVLVLHGTQDRAVDYSLGQKVYARLGEPKDFWEIPGGGHMDAFWAQDGLYRRRFLERLRKL